MTATLRCELTELEVSSCAHCRKLPDRPPELRRLGRPFAAAYAGRCTDCDERFDVGDRIRADGEGGYLCADCGEDG